MNEHECAECGGVFWYDGYIQPDVFACPDCGAPIQADDPPWYWFDDGPNEFDDLYDLYEEWNAWREFC